MAATPKKFARSPSVRERVEDTLSAHRNELVSLLSRSPNVFISLRLESFEEEDCVCLCVCVSYLSFSTIFLR